MDTTTPPKTMSRRQLLDVQACFGGGRLGGGGGDQSAAVIKRQLQLSAAASRCGGALDVDGAPAGPGGPAGVGISGDGCSGGSGGNPGGVGFAGHRRREGYVRATDVDVFFHPTPSTSPTAFVPVLQVAKPAAAPWLGFWRIKYVGELTSCVVNVPRA